MNDLLQVQGINSKGFGTIPKLVMQDRRLSIQAKAIYAYFCSYAGAGQSAFPGRSKIVYDLRISKDNYYRHVNQLKAFGYLLAEQEKSCNGQFQRNLYTLIQQLPCPQNKDTAPCPVLPCPVLPDTVNKDTNSNSIQNKQSLKRNSQSCPAPVPITSAPSQSETDEADVTEQMILAQIEGIRNQIDYADFIRCQPEDKRLLDEIVSIILDVMVTDGKHVLLDGESRPRALVRYQLGLLGYESIELVLEQFKAHTAPIKRKRQYLLTMLYNSKLELDAHYTNEVNSDWSGGR